MTRGILHVNYLGIIIGLIIAIGVQFMTIKELRQFSVETGVNCIRNSKTMTQEEIEYCLPVMDMLGFRYKDGS
jgi:hypothetical protein|tara:strand:+ start:1748 stop:1966 length:219 start_codon:yes stop_codon:yes gene_type:complete